MVNGITVTDELHSFKIAAGTEVTITATPDSGYIARVVDTIVWAGTIGELEYEESGNTYTFTMPAYEAEFDVFFYPTDSVAINWYDDEAGYNITDYVSVNEYVQVYWPGMSDRVFVGWAVDSPTSSEIIPAGSYYKFTKDTKLYAVYEDGIILTFHYPDFEMPLCVAAGEPIDVSGGYTAEDGRYVAGWSLTEDGEPLGDYYTFTKNTHLYPVYGYAVTVSFHHENESENYSVACEIGEEFVIPSGSRYYITKCWRNGSDSSEYYLPGETVVATENLDLYEEVATSTVTLTFHSNDSRDKSATKIVPKNFTFYLSSYTSDYDPFTAPYGKALLGWSRTPGGSILEDSQIFASNTDLYAVWDDQVLVTYDANGGVGNMQVIKAKGACAEQYTSRSSMFGKSGYMLAGWATDKAGTKPYDFSKPLTGDLTLYAVWGKAIEVRYIFTVGEYLYGWIDGDPVAKNDTGIYKIPMDHDVMEFVPNDQYPPEGYEFYTWYYSVDTEGDYYVTTAESWEDGTECIWIEFEAGWRPTSGIVTVECDGYVKSAKVGTRILADGEKYITDVGDTVKLTVVPKSGYVVESVSGGYYDYDARRYKEVTITEASGGYTFTAPKGEVEINVSCRPSDSFAVTYHWGGDEEPYSVYVTADDYVTLYGDFYSEDSQVLCGWAVGSADSETILTPESCQKFTKATDLYAVYETGVALRYHWSAEDVTTDYVISGQPGYVMILGAVTEDGKYAYAWSDRQNSDGTGDPAGTLYYGGYNVFYRDTDLYPVYTDAVKVTLHYGSGRTDTWYMMADETRMLPDAVRDDPIKHWAVGSASGTQKYAPGEEVSFDKDTELYAVMATDTVTLTLHSNDIRDVELTRTVAKTVRFICLRI